MSADAVSADGGFSAGLLDPAKPLPLAVRGHTPRRYAVYRNNVTVGLVRAMEANFPAIRRLLGETYFAGLARSFIQAHPPQSPLLFHYGEALAGFLEVQEDLHAYPYLSDVARLEQMWRLAYHAADAPVLHSAGLQGLSETEMFNMCLTLHPAAALLQSSFAIHAIFTANRVGGGGLVADPRQAERVLITRPWYEVQVRAITPGEHAFIALLAEGSPLGEAAEQGYASDDDFDLAASIRLILEAGAFQSTAA
jgi:hypothetical protein